MTPPTLVAAIAITLLQALNDVKARTSALVQEGVNLRVHVAEKESELRAMESDMGSTQRQAAAAKHSLRHTAAATQGLDG